MKRKSLFHNFASLGLIQISNFLLPLISLPIISRIIGLENYGVIQYSFSVISFLNIFIGYGFNFSATRRLAKDPYDKKLRDKIFSEVFYCQLILFIISFILFFLLYLIFPILNDDPKVSWFSFLYCVSILFTQNWIFQAMQDMSKITILNLSGKFVYLFLVLIIVNDESRYYWQPLVLSGTQIVIGLFSLFWAMRIFNLKFVKIRFNRLFSILIEDRSIFVSSIASSLYVSINLLVLGLFVHKNALGGFTSAQKLISVGVQLLALPISQVLYPFLSIAYRKNINDGIMLTKRFVPIVVIFSFAFSSITFFLAEKVVLFFFGSAFYESIILLKILSLIPFFNSLNKMLGIQFLINLNLDKIYLKSVLTVTLMSILFNAFLSFKFSVIGTAITWLFTEIILFIFLYFELKNLGVIVFSKKLFRINDLLNTIKIIKN